MLPSASFPSHIPFFSPPFPNSDPLLFSLLLMPPPYHPPHPSLASWCLPLLISGCWDIHMTTFVKRSSGVSISFSCPVSDQVTSNESLQLRGLWKCLKVYFCVWVNIKSVMSLSFSINKLNINIYEIQFGLISTSSSSSPSKKVEFLQKVRLLFLSLQIEQVLTEHQ